MPEWGLPISPLNLAVAGAALACLIAIRTIRARLRKQPTIECPACGQIMQPGRRYCPFCKEPLIRY